MNTFKRKTLFWISAVIVAFAMAPAFSESSKAAKPAPKSPPRKAVEKPKKPGDTSSAPPRAATLTVIK